MATPRYEYKPTYKEPIGHYVEDSELRDIAEKLGLSKLGSLRQLRNRIIDFENDVNETMSNEELRRQMTKRGFSCTRLTPQQWQHRLLLPLGQYFEENRTRIMQEVHKEATKPRPVRFWHPPDYEQSKPKTPAGTKKPTETKKPKNTDQFELDASSAYHQGYVTGFKQAREQAHSRRAL